MEDPDCADMWKLMTEFNFQIDPDSISDDMSCFLCKNLMVDACICVCGCQYCHKCICEYIRDVDKFCPGNKTKCKMGYLSLDNDVIRDKRMNVMILKSKVLCPNESCQSKLELIQMEEHLRICSKQSMECPYAALGCDIGEQVKDSILTHINSEALQHTQLLLEYIHNLRNEVDGLKSNCEKSQMEILSLRLDSGKKDIKIAEIIEEMTSLKHEMKEEITNLNQEMKSVKEKGTHQEKRIATLEGLLREVNDGMESRLSAIIEERAKMNTETEERIIGRMEAQNKEINDRMNEQIREMLSSMKVQSEREIINKGETRMNDWIKSCPNIDADFIWKIDGWTEKRRLIERKRHFMREYIHSELFYSKNYKLCLRLRIHSDDFIRLGCLIMRGNNDDNVQWPMRHKVTLSIINQDTLKPHKSVTLQYDTHENKCAFDRPKKNANDYGIATTELIKYSSIKDNPSIIADDSIVVSCIFTDL